MASSNSIFLAVWEIKDSRVLKSRVSELIWCIGSVMSRDLEFERQIFLADLSLSSICPIMILDFTDERSPDAMKSCAIG